ncbi:MAG: CARDB domain-containing protein, partial [Gaiellaceae bacterium]
ASKHDEYANYMSQVRAVAQSSAKVGREFAAKLGSSGLKLADLETSLEQWSQQQQQDYDQAQQIQPPGPLRVAHQQVLDTLQLRAMGLAALANALAQTKAKDASTAAAQLANEAQLLTASDIVWANLYRLPATATLKTLGVTGVVAPVSQFVTNPDVVSTRAFEIVYQELRPVSTGSSASGVRGDNLVSTKAVGGGKTVTLDPSNPTTIYVSTDLSIQATVEDSGNFAEVNIPVTMTISAGGKKLVTQTKTIAGLQAGEQQTVEFKSLDLTADAFRAEAQIKVDVKAVPGEQKLDNNTAAYPVFFSLATP